MGRLRAVSRARAILAVALLVVVATAALPAASGSSTPAPAAPGNAQGYWLAGADGSVYAFGSAASYGSLGGQPAGNSIAGLARTPSGGGYWLVGTDGGIFAFGDATFFGSTGHLPLNRPIVGMAPTPTGKGYWFVASDGGIFAFGDAGFYGSTGNLRLNKPIVGMTATPTGKGYWFVASDGGIFAFGDAGFYGSTGNLRLNRPIVGMAPTPTGKGYWFVASDGGIFSFGDAAFAGSAGGRALPGAVIGMASPPPPLLGEAAGPAAPTASTVPATTTSAGPPPPPPSTSSTTGATTTTISTTTTTAPVPVVPDPFDIGLVGDTGYSGAQVQTFADVVRQMNQFPLDFVVHDGDFKDPTSPCDDARFAQARASFNRSAHPFIYTPGDNEWMDCADDPVGRLGALRGMFFPTDESLGRTRLPLTTQRSKGYAENARWIRGGVVFATFNVPGPNDNIPNPDESGPRRQANFDWLDAAFDTAKATKAPAVMLIWQADPTPAGFDQTFKYLVDELKQRAKAFRKPVVLVHGDTHTYRIDQPWPEVPNLTRVETHALVDSNYWIRATVDPSDPKVFTFTDEHVG